MARIRADYVFGTTTAAITATDTTLTSAALARLPVVSGSDVAPVTLHDSATGVYEVVYVTAHAASATTATISRAQEGSTARAWATGATWLHGPTSADFKASNIPFTPTGTVAATDVQAAIAEVAAEAGTGGGGTGGGWTLVVNEAGSSVSNFTPANGTFQVVSGVIQGTPNSNECLAIYNLPVATSMFVLEGEINILTAGGASADTHAGFVASCSASAGPGISSRLHCNGGVPDKIETEVNATAGRVSTVKKWGNQGEWHKLRQVIGGGVCAVYVDGVLIHSAGNNAQQSNDASRFALRVGNCTAQFRNIKAWVPTLPA